MSCLGFFRLKIQLEQSRVFKAYVCRKDAQEVLWKSFTLEEEGENEEKKNWLLPSV